MGQVAGSSRSNQMDHGCGATEERFHGRLLWQTLRPCGRGEFRNPEHREQPPICVCVSRPLSGLQGQARNNIEDTVISGMLISEFIRYRGLRYRTQLAVISPLLLLLSRLPLSRPILTQISEVWCSNSTVQNSDITATPISESISEFRYCDIGVGVL